MRFLIKLRRQRTPLLIGLLVVINVYQFGYTNYEGVGMHGHQLRSEEEGNQPHPPLPHKPDVDNPLRHKPTIYPPLRHKSPIEVPLKQEPPDHVDLENHGQGIGIQAVDHGRPSTKDMGIRPVKHDTNTISPTPAAKMTTTKADIPKMPPKVAHSGKVDDIKINLPKVPPEVAHPVKVDDIKIKLPKVQPEVARPAMADDIKTILLYTAYFGSRTWRMNIELGQKVFANMGCPERRCNLTPDRSLQRQSEIMLIHTRDFPKDIVSQAAVRPPGQVWAFVTLEPPHNTNTCHGAFDGLFNWTISYKEKSEVVWNYGSLVQRHTPVMNIINYAEGKSRLALWTSSNCGIKYRREYVFELQKYIQVDTFGKSRQCTKQNDPCPIDGAQTYKYYVSNCTMEMRKKYKFYLSFENVRCTDYVTEKFWWALRDGLLPVVMGTNIDTYRKIAPPHSFLHIDDFKSPKALAEYMEYLDRNDTAYSEYMNWRQYYDVNVGYDRPLWLCDLCKLAHTYKQVLPHKVYNLTQWNDAQSNCEAYPGDELPKPGPLV